jgi:hypothetical protein
MLKKQALGLELSKAGLYNPTSHDHQLDFSDVRTKDNGVYQDLNMAPHISVAEWITPLAKQTPATSISHLDSDQLGYAAGDITEGGLYQVEGRTVERMAEVADKYMPDYINTPSGKAQLEGLTREGINAGLDPVTASKAAILRLQLEARQATERLAFIGKPTADPYELQKLALLGKRMSSGSGSSGAAPIPEITTAAAKAQSHIIAKQKKYGLHEGLPKNATEEQKKEYKKKQEAFDTERYSNPSKFIQDVSEPISPDLMVRYVTGQENPVTTVDQIKRGESADKFQTVIVPASRIKEALITNADGQVASKISSAALLGSADLKESWWKKSSAEYVKALGGKSVDEAAKKVDDILTYIVHNLGDTKVHLSNSGFTFDFMNKNHDKFATRAKAYVSDTKLESIINKYLAENPSIKLDAGDIINLLKAKNDSSTAGSQNRALFRETGVWEAYVDPKTGKNAKKGYGTDFYEINVFLPIGLDITSNYAAHQHQFKSHGAKTLSQTNNLLGQEVVQTISDNLADEEEEGGENGND